VNIARTVLKATWPFLWRVVKRFNEDQGTVLSGHIAYSLMLSVVPFLIFATALTGFIVGAEESQAALNALFAHRPAPGRDPDAVGAGFDLGRIEWGRSSPDRPRPGL
jgi:uncharacterized BrkB/YihY/UPF0761 family membrane protein